jgi:predicted dehydrogenase
MPTHPIGVIMNGVTGRMGANQHLVRSILAIRAQGGVRLGENEAILPEPVLVGRNEDKLRALAQAYGGLRFSTDLDDCLSDPELHVYFDALRTDLRAANVRKAIAAGKAVYCEKPTADTAAEALELYRAAEAAGVPHGVVHDKLWLPGIRKLKHLVDAGFFGRILSVRGEFGYWVFDGTQQPGQRPSWNYIAEEGGGIVLDMFSHWRYLLDNLFGEVRAVSCYATTHIPERVDERGQRYACTAADAAYATFLLDGEIACQLNSSWAVRVYRDDLATFQVDGTRGSAVAGLRECLIQPDVATPRPVWNPDIEQPIDFYAGWQPIPPLPDDDNAFKAQWELFLKHVVRGDPFPWTLLSGAKGVQLAERATQSVRERRWIDVEPLTA